eukprot:1320511-Amphidinium_carterae.1
MKGIRSTLRMNVVYHDSMASWSEKSRLTVLENLSRRSLQVMTGIEGQAFQSGTTPAKFSVNLSPSFCTKCNRTTCMLMLVDLQW